MLKKHQKKLRENETFPEYLLWQFIKDKKLEGYKFRRQEILLDYIVDFVCYEKKLIIELDGEHHAEQEDDDNLRTEKLEAAGFHVLRFWNEQVLGDLGGVLNMIVKHLKNDEEFTSSFPFAQFHLDPTGPLIRPTGTLSLAPSWRSPFGRPSVVQNGSPAILSHKGRRKSR